MSCTNDWTLKEAPRTDSSVRARTSFFFLFSSLSFNQGYNETLNFFFEMNNFFSDRLVTVIQVWETHGVTGQGDIRFLFC
jgi:hypothetical protein